MKTEYVVPFVEAAISVLKDMCMITDIKRGQLNAKNDAVVTRGVAPLIGVTGQISGRVVYDMDTRTALKLASIMNGETFSEWNEFVESTIEEFANIVTGQALTGLNNKGIKVDLTPPVLFTGQNMKIANTKMMTLIVPLELSIGRIEINVSLQENK
ncbi:MAG TPA: chemotaxis protein CheX [bacterium]|nr:chemotaxis protein CheX [bacterium]HOL47128.1 chemotaxis protein CheX [bacterium]HPQ17917.1 chemotaxis protein CheX [bacterium]